MPLSLGTRIIAGSSLRLKHVIFVFNGDCTTCNKIIVIQDVTVKTSHYGLFPPFQFFNFRIGSSIKLFCKKNNGSSLTILS